MLQSRYNANLNALVKNRYKSVVLLWLVCFLCALFLLSPIAKAKENDGQTQTLNICTCFCCSRPFVCCIAKRDGQKLLKGCVCRLFVRLYPFYWVVALTFANVSPRPIVSSYKQALTPETRKSDMYLYRVGLLAILFPEQINVL